jgi:hypothetical protein
LVEPDPPIRVEPQDLVAAVRSPDSPRELRLFAARGLLPLERDDRIRALLAVLTDEDPSIGAPARETFALTPPDDIVRFLDEGSPTVAEIEVVSQSTQDHFVLERIIRHPDSTDETLLRLAGEITGAPQEALIVNQVRLLRQPALIEALFGNPGLTADGRRRLDELREEFFEKEKRRREQERLRREEEERRARQEAEGIVFEDAAEAAATDGSGALLGEAEGEVTADPGVSAIYRRISIMTAKEKVELAQKGNKEERRILIADANKIVSMAVLSCESVTQAEIEAFCTMRHLGTEIFQAIASTREWIKKPRIQFALVTNPAVPLSITLPLVKFLGLRDLRNIGRDRNLPEGVRLMARKVLTEKRG